MGYYETLNVSKTATPEEIKKSYRKLVKEYHPDKTGGDDTRFKQIAEAYEVLGDSDRRKKHDLLNNPANPFEFNFKNGSGFSDMFDDMYGSSAKGANIKISINLTFEEIYEGTRRYINTGDGGFNINIPRGITNGAKLKVKGKGHPHPYNSAAPNGDAIIVVYIMQDLDLVVNGTDIYVDLYLDWLDLLIGGEFEVKTKIHSVKIKVPQGSYDSKILRVIGKGMPIYNTEGFGNLMVKLRTNNIELTEHQINSLKNIKENNG